MNELSGFREGDLVRLTHGHCNGTLVGAEFDRLEQILRNDAEARAFFRRCLGLDAMLRDYGENAASHWLAPNVAASAESPQSGAGTSSVVPAGKFPSEPGSTLPHPKGSPVSNPVARLRLVGIAGAALVSTAAICVLVFARNRAEADVIGRLEQVAGDVRVLGADGEVRTIGADVSLRSGDTVRTHGEQSSTSVVYPDGTRLILVGDTSVTCGDRRSKNVVVHRGTLAASVQPQPLERPMLLATPTARMQVLGTRFLVEALEGRTDLSVSEGRVRLVRVRDGEAVDVPDGKFAVVTEQNRLVVRDTPELSVDWEADFEDGLPDDWESGEFVAEGLPPGSRGAVGSVREESDQSDGGAIWIVRSTNGWLQGLFAARENSHLHFTYKMDRPKWVNVFFQTRTSDPRDRRFSANYLFNELPKVPAGRWHTASIPLVRFDRLAGGDPSLEDLVPFKLMISSDADRGLVIDRIWVTSDGPGEVEVKPVE